MSLVIFQRIFKFVIAFLFTASPLHYERAYGKPDHFLFIVNMLLTVAIAFLKFQRGTTKPEAESHSSLQYHWYSKGF